MRSAILHLMLGIVFTTLPALYAGVSITYLVGVGVVILGLLFLSGAMYKFLNIDSN